MSSNLTTTPHSGYESLARMHSSDVSDNSTTKKSLERINYLDWIYKLNNVKIAKNDLNKLIMNYLVVEGYKDVAETFSREAQIKPYPDFDSIELRMNIINHVKNGEIEKSIDLVNDYNPEIFDTNPRLYFHVLLQRLIEYIRANDINRALSFAQEELTLHAEQNQDLLDELEQVMSLLAFDDSSNSPLSGLLNQSQRQKLADELNNAILGSENQTQESKLLNLIKILLWAQNQLDDSLIYPRIKNLKTSQLEYSDKQ